MDKYVGSAGEGSMLRQLLSCCAIETAMLLSWVTARDLDDDLSFAAEASTVARLSDFRGGGKFVSVLPGVGS